MEFLIKYRHCFDNLTLKLEQLVADFGLYQRSFEFFK